MKRIEGDFNAHGHKYGLVVARFNQPITQLLLDGAVDCFKRHGVQEDDLALAWVPGAFEIPLVAKKMAESKRYDGIVCIGAVIRGETAHFEYVASQAASGILQTSLVLGIPVLFSVLTTETKEQAEIRAGTKGTNIGFSYALAAIEMVNLIKKI